MSNRLLIPATPLIILRRLPKHLSDAPGHQRAGGRHSPVGACLDYPPFQKDDIHFLLVDVLDIFFFFRSGEGKGESEGVGRGSIFIENPRRGGVCRGAKLGLFGFLAFFPQFYSVLGGGK